jgi:peptidyl-prolyl cis-trans isomerase D
VIEVPVHDVKTGAQVAERLRKGEDPYAVAKSVGVQALPYTDAPRGAIADKRVADAAFGMTAGQVQGPVQGDLGLAVLKLVTVTPGHAATLDEVRQKIEAEVRHDAAQAVVDKQVQKYEDARTGGATLVQAAKTLDAVTATLPPVTAEGTTAELQPRRVPMPPQLLAAGFAAKAGGDTDLIDLGQGEYAALHVDKVTPPAPIPLDQSRPLLARALMQRDITTRLSDTADAVAAQIAKGQTMEAAAAAAGVPLQHAGDITRQAAGKTFSNPLLSKVFTGKPGDVVTGQDMKPGMVVAKIEGTVPASGRGASQDAANARRQASQTVVQDLAVAVRAAAKEIIKPKVDYAKVRAAVGGQGAAGPAAS